MLITTSQKFNSVSNQIIRTHWNSLQQYNFTGNRFPMHYYAIVDGDKNDLNALQQKYKNSLPLGQEVEGTLENAFCKTIKSGFLFHQGYYDFED